MTDNKTPRLPVVGEYVRKFGRVVDIVDLTPPPPNKVVNWIFEYVEADVVVQSKSGVVLVNHSSFCDYYGEGTAVKEAIESAKCCVVHYGEGVVVVVIKTTKQRQMIPTNEKSFCNSDFFEFGAVNAWCRVDLPDPVEEVVWRSDNLEFMGVPT